MSPWTAASWLLEPHRALDHLTPLVVIADGGVDDVLVAARNDASRTAQ